MPNKSVLFTREALVAAMEVAKGSVVAAGYLLSQGKKIFTAAKKNEEFKELISKLESFVSQVEMQLMVDTGAWSGKETPSSTFHSYQSEIAEEAAKILGGIQISEKASSTHKLSYAFDDSGHFVRGWGKLDSKATNALDKLFNAWLALNDIVSKGGSLYQADNKGHILADAQGKEKLVDPVSFKSLIDDPARGFKFYADKKGVPMDTEKKEFPKKDNQEASSAISAG